jgi:hypothetical protein
MCTFIPGERERELAFQKPLSLISGDLKHATLSKYGDRCFQDNSTFLYVLRI